jgi:hypothetical protein
MRAAPATGSVESCGLGRPRPSSESHFGAGFRSRRSRSRSGRKRSSAQRATRPQSQRVDSSARRGDRGWRAAARDSRLGHGGAPLPARSGATRSRRANPRARAGARGADPPLLPARWHQLIGGTLVPLRRRRRDHPCSELVGPDLPPTKLERGSVPPDMAGRCSSQALPGNWSPARCRRMLRSGISVRIDSRTSIVPSTSSSWSSPDLPVDFRPSTRNRHPCPMRRAGCRPCRTALSAVRMACARSRTGLASAARGCSPSSVLAGSARRARDWRWRSRCSAVFAAGARFVSLASVRRAQNVPAAVVQALRIVQLSRQRAIGCRLAAASVEK